MEIRDMDYSVLHRLTEQVVGNRLRFHFLSHDSNLERFAAAVRTGLTSKRKFLQPVYFYDKRGSQLFNEITKQPEYYLTRVEASILRSSSENICRMCGRGTIIELGSGNSEKTRIVLDALMAREESLHYVPIDVSYESLAESSEALMKKYPALSVTCLVSEYDEGMSFVERHVGSSKLVLFLGSSIGNFDPEETGRFLQMIRNCIGDGDRFLIGLDMHKDIEILNVAYDDSGGVTAQFNLNILARINRELGGRFSLEKFEHHAFYNERLRRVEMHLVSKEAQDVRISAINDTISFEEGETIHTENSYKFTAEQIEGMIDGCFEVSKTWTDPRGWYSVLLLRPV
jgi:dimethylhistidine N-methyltransferase